MTTLLNLWQRWTFAPTDKYCWQLRANFYTFVCGRMHGKPYRIKTTIGWYYAEKAKTA